MSNEEKQVLRMEDFARMLSAKTGFTKGSILEVLRSIDDTMKLALEQATQDSKVEVHLTPGIKFINEYREPVKRRSFVTGKVEECPAHFATKVKLGKGLKRVGEN